MKYQIKHNKTRFAACGSQALNHSKPKHGIRACSLRNFPGSPRLPSEIFVVMALWKVRLVNRIVRMKPRTCTTTPVESRTARSPNSLLRLSLGRGLPQSRIMSHHVTSNSHSNCVICVICRNQKNWGRWGTINLNCNWAVAAQDFLYGGHCRLWEALPKHSDCIERPFGTAKTYYSRLIHTYFTFMIWISVFLPICRILSSNSMLSVVMVHGLKLAKVWIQRLCNAVRLNAQ